MNHGPLKIRHRGHLPHWEAPGATYAVTFRLADSLPQAVLDRIRRERNAIPEAAAQMGRELTPQEQERLDELYNERIEEFLDSGAGACHLRHPPVGQAVFDAVRFFHPERYVLYAWCVMPNHVHALFCPTAPHTLKTILHSWKSFTSLQANRMLGRSGTLWMAEYYDHLIRDQPDFRWAWKYILDNPQKARLANWPWVASLAEANTRGQDVRATCLGHPARP
jgi:REP element-mobilizing transposase RayT